MSKAFSRDFAPSRGTDLHTVEKIGNTRELLPDGSLLCKDVPIARTGEMKYDESELLDDNGDPVCSSPDGIVHVVRGPDELFSERVIRSFEGAHVTLGHPPVQVTPQNYKRFSRGFIRNVRQGEGTMSDHLVADLVVRDAGAIKAIENDTAREVSPGYDADYEPIEGDPGWYRQTGIIGNHLAIVERGRGGRTVRIGDSERGANMAFKKKSWGERLIKAITTGDADEAEEAIRAGAEEAPDDQRTVVVDNKTNDEDPMAQCMAAITGLSEKIDGLPAAIAAAIKSTTTDEESEEERERREAEAGRKTNEELKGERREEAKTGDADETDEKEARDCTMDEAECVAEPGKVPTGDAAFNFVRKHTVSVAEILSPGLRSGTMDSSASVLDQRKSINALRALALDNAMKDAVMGPIVRPIVGRRGARALSHDALFRAFVDAGKAVAEKNNSSRTGSRMSFASDGISPAIKTMQERNKEFWSRK